MKLSTKGRYGVRLMLDLALHFGQGPVLLKDIARRQDISEKYLGQLIAPLKNAGLIRSTRGAHGGYELNKKPAEVTLKDIVVELEGPISILDCVDNPLFCRRANTCIARDIWCEVSEKIIQTLESFTLDKVIERQKSKPEAIAYAI